MISFLTGHLADKSLTRTVVEVHGIGFEILIPMSTYDRLPSVGEQVTLVTYLHVREDHMLLFGFHTEAEKTLFTMLIASVSGIGPKLALNILSSMPVSTFCQAVADKDLKRLSRISGIGKRSAERLVIELKDKIHDVLPEVGGADAASALSPESRKAAEDAAAALMTLGFKAETARKTIHQLVSEPDAAGSSAEQLIRLALKRLNK